MVATIGRPPCGTQQQGGASAPRCTGSPCCQIPWRTTYPDRHQLPTPSRRPTHVQQWQGRPPGRPDRLEPATPDTRIADQMAMSGRR